MFSLVIEGGKIVAATTVLGAAIGTLILPVVGTTAGAYVGGFLGAGLGTLGVYIYMLSERDYSKCSLIGYCVKCR